MALATIKLFLILLAIAAIGEWLSKLSKDRANRQVRKHEEEMEKAGLKYTKY